MMGERDPQKHLWSYQVNLAKRVRSDHPLRRTNQTLELDFVRREFANFYGTQGNVSEDPVVIMKMMLLLYLDSRASWADAADRVRRCGSWATNICGGHRNTCRGGRIGRNGLSDAYLCLRDDRCASTRFRHCADSERDCLRRASVRPRL
jgi:hypothetical protein